MATLVLTVVGGMIGGPVGAAIGATIGNAVDRDILFKPKGREGPRLTDLSVQTSSYGTPIARLFGTIRVAGSVIWATDLIEHRNTQGGGKGRPSTTTYSYTASFAVLLSARPIRAVHRIWADGKLLRGAAGDFKTRTGFRLYAGDEDQPPDPLIAAAEAGLTPAHRGCAYAVFENLELGDFGNRIPSLTFEVEADEAGCSVGTIVAALSDRQVTGAAGLLPLDGFSAYGASVRAVIEPLAEAACAWCVAEPGGLALTSGAGTAVAITDDGARAEGSRGARRARSIASADAAPRTMALAHYDPARDYQAGLQRAARPGAGTREGRIELPAALSASAAKTLAEAALARGDVERERRTVTLDWRALELRPGDRVTIDGEPGQWRVDRWSLEAMALTLECMRIAPAALPATASGGRAAAAPDRTLGTTLLVTAELPMLDDSLASAPQLAVLAAGSQPGWRNAALLLSVDGGIQWSAAGGTAPAAVLGTITAAPGWAPATLTDRVHAIEVELAHAEMALHDADPAAIEAGTNLALAGDELLQFQAAESLGGRRWRLSGLWRGRRGTEAAIGTQAAGDRFALITADTLSSVPLPLAALGGAARLLASGAGDVDGPAQAEAPVDGASIVPPSPVHLRARTLPDSTTELRWVRRSRSGWRWVDGVDTPLGEETERYRVTLIPETGLPRSIETEAPQTILAAGDRTGSLAVEVRQIGANGLSRAASIILPPI